MSVDNSTKDRSLPTLLRELSEETTTLIQQEIRLAKVELEQRVREAGAGAGMLGGAALFGLAGFLALTFAVIAALALALPMWAAALIVAVVYGIAAYIIAQTGKKQLEKTTPVLPETTQTVKEDIAWAKTVTKSASK